jgi:CheY-like chemotaxis protein
MPPSVLVVDDVDGIREAIRLVLEVAEYSLYEAPDGKPAFVRLREHPEGMVVLLDVQMPGMDGISVLRALAAGERLVAPHAIVLVSARDPSTLLPDVAALLMQMGVHTLTEPFLTKDLLAAVQSAAHRLAHGTSGEQPLGTQRYPPRAEQKRSSQTRKWPGQRPRAWYALPPAC